MKRSVIFGVILILTLISIGILIYVLSNSSEEVTTTAPTTITTISSTTSSSTSVPTTTFTSHDSSTTEEYLSTIRPITTETTNEPTTEKITTTIETTTKPETFTTSEVTTPFTTTPYMTSQIQPITQLLYFSSRKYLDRDCGNQSIYQYSVNDNGPRFLNEFKTPYQTCLPYLVYRDSDNI